MLHLDHNCMHASDVLHGVFFMTTKKIPGFAPSSLKLGDGSESDSDSGLNGERQQKNNTGDYGILMDSIPLLELLALYTAATMHDYDHPGRTNAFLVSTLSQQVSLFSFSRTYKRSHTALSARTVLFYGAALLRLALRDISEDQLRRRPHIVLVGEFLCYCFVSAF